MPTTTPARHTPHLRRPPRQARSRDTLRRIVAATRELLEQKTFDEISIADITRRANSSVGSFYARFPDKAALLDHLDELYARSVIDQAEGLADPACFADAPLEERVRALVSFLIQLHSAQPGLLRTLILEARRRPGGRFGERTRRMTATIPSLMERLLERRHEMGHPDPERAVILGLLMVFSAIREVVLFPEALAGLVDYEKEDLVNELTDAYLAYLRVKR